METKNQLKDIRNSLISSKGLLKLLSRIWGLEDQRSYGISLFSALRVEFDQARAQIDELIQEQKLDHDEVSCLKKRFMEEKLLWKAKEKERIKSVVNNILEELESEKKLRRRAERLNKKLGDELANTRATLSKAIKELESERKSREIIEQVCNEVVRGVGEDKAKAQEELEKEREMLHLADEWREERVQMKLFEAKVQFEEKNAAVDRLRSELETFLDKNRRKGVEADRDEEQGDDGDSVESDLHSIELNMESNNQYSWSHGLKSGDTKAKLLGSAYEKLDQDTERYVSVKKLRDRMLAGTRVVLPRGLSSPTRQWSRSQAAEDMDQVSEGLKASEIVKAIKEGGSKERLSKSSAFVRS